jgi:serine/threonine protein kinase/tetratricopeptide (TPR) repeat protein
MEQIGEGGMGLVFVAEQQQPVRRKVALKLIKPGMDSKQVIARFEAERQALAMMDHPNIAKVHDGGVTPEGRPYFVMELVKGLPITVYCDKSRLGTRLRLELFLDVCHAVQHAHQKGIIHRDLKPSNILVEVHDVRPVVKIIDFGISKAIGQQLTDKTLYTGMAHMVGTPMYMSPEQAGLSSLDVDTRSDVYSLGVLLYELLIGAPPFESETLKKAGYDEMRRIIREEEPPKPSTRLSTLQDAALSTICERRGAELHKLQQQVRGELDWIVMRALEKDRDRRYESASTFAADIERYLGDEPVEACPPSAGYRLRKFAHRNRRALITAGVISATLVAATVVSAWQAVVARDAQHQAETARKQAELDRDRAKTAERQAKTDQEISRAVNDFLQVDLLRQTTSMSKLDQDPDASPFMTVKEALDRAAAHIGQRFQDQPLVEAAIRTAIGAAYNAIWDHKRAVPHLEWAVAVRKARLGPSDPNTFHSMEELAQSYQWTGRHTDAIALSQQLLENRKALLGPDHPETLNQIGTLAFAYQFAGQLETSRQLVESLIEKRRAILGPTHFLTLETMEQLGTIYYHEQRFAESMDLLEKILNAIETTYGTQHDRTTGARKNFARACMRAGKFDQADRLLREALEQVRRLEDSHGRRVGIANCFGWLAVNLLLQQKYVECEPLAREALAIYEKIMPDAPWRFYWESVVGAALLGRQEYAEAEPLLLRGYEGIKQRAINAQIKGQVIETGQWLVHFYEATNHPDQAAAWREKVNLKLPDAAPTGVK